MGDPTRQQQALPDDDFIRHGALWLPREDLCLHAHRRALSQWPLHDLAARLPAVQYRTDELPPCFWHPTTTFVNSPGHVRLACSELVRHAVLWAPSFAFSEGNMLAAPPPRIKLSHLLSNAMGLRLEVDDFDPSILERDGIHAFLFGQMSPQWEFMRSHAFRFAQALWMFDHALGARATRATAHSRTFRREGLEAAFRRSLGMSVAEFVRSVAMLFARSVSDDPTIDSGSLYLSPETLDGLASWLTTGDGDQKLTRVLLPKAFDLLAASPSEMRQQLADEARTTSEVEMLKGPSPLQRHPILLPFSNSRARGVAPVPHLLVEYLYEPLIDLLYSSSRTERLSGDFDQLFEEYVGLLLNRHSPISIRWHHEYALLPRSGGSVIDWAAEFRSHVVLVEAKRAWLDPATRHGLDRGDWDQFHKTLLHGLKQGAGFWRSVKAGSVAALREARYKRPVLVLAVGSDARVLPYPERLKRELLECAHQQLPDLQVVLVWLDQLHDLLNTWRTRDVEWLPEALSRSAQPDGPDLGSQLSRDASGPLWREFTEPLQQAGTA